MKDLVRTTADRAARYLASLQERSVAPTPEALANLARFDEPFPEHPTDAAKVIALLGRLGGWAVLRVRGRRVAPGDRRGEQSRGRVGSERGDRRPLAHRGAP